MAVNVFRSELFYRAPVTVGIEQSIRPQSRVRELIQKAWDAVWEYPGSVKGDYGEWRLTYWVAGKIEQIISRAGTERR